MNACDLEASFNNMNLGGSTDKQEQRFRLVVFLQQCCIDRKVKLFHGHSDEAHLDIDVLVKAVHLIEQLQ